MDIDKKLEQLRFRRELARLFIQTLETDPELEGHPLQPNAVKEYRDQFKKIDDKIKVLENKLQNPDEQEPEPIVIGLKTAKLTGKSGL